MGYHGNSKILGYHGNSKILLPWGVQLHHIFYSVLSSTTDYQYEYAASQLGGEEVEIDCVIVTILIYTY